MADSKQAKCHDRLLLTKSDRSSATAPSQKPSAFTTTVRRMPHMAVAGDVLDVFRDNLVHPLSRKTECVSYLGEALASEACHFNVLVTSFLASRARRQRSPLPARKHLQTSNPLRRKLAFPFTLTGVIDPIAEPKFLPIQLFDMNSRDCAVPLSKTELIQCSNVQKESLIMIHTVYNSKEKCYLQPYGGGNNGF